MAVEWQKNVDLAKACHQPVYYNNNNQQTVGEERIYNTTVVCWLWNEEWAKSPEEGLRSTVQASRGYLWNSQ